MKHIFLNLKRFDVPSDLGGVNRIGEKDEWAKSIINDLDACNEFDFTFYFPESSIIPAVKEAKYIKIGCQGVYHKDVETGKNFGAFTTYRTAKSMACLGVKSALIGHCEERNGKNELLTLGGGKGDVNEILNQEIQCAIKAGLNVLYCIGEKAEEQDRKYEVLRHQIEVGLKEVDLSKICIAYEPVWAIGPGKTPPGKDYIEDIVNFVKSIVDVPVVYGGGLKVENAEMLASIEKLDGGLIALTKFGADFGFTTKDFKEIVKTYQKGLKQ